MTRMPSGPTASTCPGTPAVGTGAASAWAAHSFTGSPARAKEAPGNGLKARTRRAMAAAGRDQSMLASAFSILCA
ncbi:hypothetical protein D3C72_2165440 [compost metagenome]